MSINKAVNDFGCSKKWNDGGNAMRFEEEEDRRVAKILRGLSPFCCVERVGARMVGPREPEVDIVWLGAAGRHLPLVLHL